ncbi:hypothetical protein DAI22_04g129601 [Oryza sativa Japonica Group]|nr:hypothetical protein DAI22_04g129601 [Oryza sativa Japonica Group]
MNFGMVTLYRSLYGSRDHRKTTPLCTRVTRTNRKERGESPAQEQLRANLPSWLKWIVNIRKGIVSANQRCATKQHGLSGKAGHGRFQGPNCVNVGSCLGGRSVWWWHCVVTLATGALTACLS